MEENMRKREEIMKDAMGLADRDRLKIEIMLDLRQAMLDIRNDLRSRRQRS